MAQQAFSQLEIGIPPGKKEGSRQVQFNFSKGVNPMQPSHLIADDEVQTATNIDFSLMNGALVPRRGSQNVNIVSSGASINKMFLNYNDPSNFGNSGFYIADSGGNVKRLVTGSDPTGAFTTIVTGGGLADPAIPPAINSYKQYALIANGGQNFKDDGTNTTEWIKQVPGTPTVTINTLAPLTTTGTWVLTNGSGFSISTDGTATFATDQNNQCAAALIGNYNLNTNAGHVLGDFAVHFIKIAFDNPQAVTKVSWDYLLDTAGENYWHYELNPVAGGAVVSTDVGQDLINAIRTDSSGNAINADDRFNIWSQISQYNFQQLSFIPNVTNKMSNWAVPVTRFNLVGTLTNTTGVDLWQNIKGIRFSVIANDVVTCTVTNPSVVGAKDFSLTDLITGYTYWETWATLDANGNKIDEGAPSLPAGPFLMQASQTVVSNASAPTGAKHGITHRITYRQGGYMQDAYAIATTTYLTTTLTDTLDDITALINNNVMLRNILGTSGGANGFPSVVLAISEPLQDRVFISDQNKLRWTLPGQVSAFPLQNVQEISHVGDDINGIVNWDPGLVIVTRGAVFEVGASNIDTQGVSVNKTGCKHGSIAPKCLIRTPYGIPLFNVDGLTLYRAGYGIDEEIPWFKARYSDIFSNSVAGWKGTRVPALGNNPHTSCAAYLSNKLYLGMCTGTATQPSTLFVLDFIRQQCWWYQYPFTFTSIMADGRRSLIYLGTPDGALITVEDNVSRNVDAVSTSTTGTQAITWTARTKQWTAESDSVLENIAIDSEGTAIQVKALYDNSNNPVVTTLGNVTRAWTIPALNGTFANSVAFDFNGTNTTTMQAMYGMVFTMLSEPARVNFWRTEYDDKSYEADKKWDVAYYDIDNLGTSTVTAVSFVDSVAIMTNTITSTTSGRLVTEVAFPAEIYGRVAYTTYTSAGRFKHWLTYYDARNEPPKINYWRTDIVSLEENICDAWDVDINPNGTSFGTAYIDNVATTTGTFTGTSRQSFTTTLPRELYGRTLYVAYTGTGLKHYQTWFHKRLEPDRWTSFVSDKQSEPNGGEHEWKVYIPEVAIFGTSNLLATAILDGTALQTYTMTASGTRQQYTLSLPVEKFGRTIWASYALDGPGFFKHYSTLFHGDPEPPKVTLYRTGPYPYPASNYLRTWQPKLDVRSGTVTGSLTVDDTLILTQTFTGSRRQWYTVGMDLVSTATPALAYSLQTGSRWEVVYSATTQFKHYETQMETTQKPYKKPAWSSSYRKSGGASQVDQARFWSIFAEVEDLAVATYWWDIDGTNVINAVSTLTNTVWVDRIAFPPGARGYLFQFRVTCDEAIKVHTLNLDLAQEGIKNLVRRGHPGAPATQNP